jgi:hypothetical protein
MKKLFRSLTFKETAIDIKNKELFEAERLEATHVSAAEHHNALAEMYGKRVARLKADEEQRRFNEAKPVTTQERLDPPSNLRAFERVHVIPQKH